MYLPRTIWRIFIYFAFSTWSFAVTDGKAKIQDYYPLSRHCHSDGFLSGYGMDKTSQPEVIPAITCNFLPWAGPYVDHRLAGKRKNAQGKDHKLYNTFYKGSYE